MVFGSALESLQNSLCGGSCYQAFLGKIQRPQTFMGKLMKTGSFLGKVASRAVESPVYQWMKKIAQLGSLFSVPLTGALAQAMEHGENAVNIYKQFKQASPEEKVQMLFPQKRVIQGEMVQPTLQKSQEPTISDEQESYSKFSTAFD